MALSRASCVKAAYFGLVHRHTCRLPQASSWSLWDENPYSGYAKKVLLQVLLILGLNSIIVGDIYIRGVAQIYHITFRRSGGYGSVGC